MIAQLVQFGGVPALICEPDGPPLASREASDLVGEALSCDARLLVIPRARLSPDFLRLSSGLAGEMLQKFVNYGLRTAIVGDIAAETEASGALRDFVRESNRGRQVWFVPDLAALEKKLGQTA